MWNKLSWTPCDWKRVFHPASFFFAGEQWWTLLDSLMARASLWNSGCFKDSCNMSRYQLFRHTMSSKQAKQTNVAVSHPLWGDDRFPHFVCIESMKRKSFSNFTEQPLRPRLIEDSSGRRKSHHQNSPCRLQFQGEYLSGHSERSTFCGWGDIVTTGHIPIISKCMLDFSWVIFWSSSAKVDGPC